MRQVFSFILKSEGIGYSSKSTLNDAAVKPLTKEESVQIEKSLNNLGYL